MPPAEPVASTCCGGSPGCVFSKALLARAATCELAARGTLGETESVLCGSPVARINCETLAALLRERTGFRLRLPRPPAPLMHTRALKLQCGGLVALQGALQAPQPDVHRMVCLAHERHGSLLDLPWQALVDAIAAWQPRRRRPSPGP